MSQITPENLKLISERHKSTIIIYLSQIGLAVLLVFAGWVYAGNIENSITSDSLMSLRIAVIFLAVTALVLRRMLLRWDRLRSIASLNGIPGILSSLQSNAIIIGTLAEIIAVVGFLVAALGGVRLDMLTFGAVSLILFLINFPRRSVWEKVVSGLGGV